MGNEQLPFAGRVSEGLSRTGMTLRGLCREAGLDPSFFSKILSGKRSPPAEEAVLRRIAGLLALDAAELIVSAGRIPSEWHALWADRDLFEDVHRRVSHLPLQQNRRPPPGGRASAIRPPSGGEFSVGGADRHRGRQHELSEELL